MQLGKKIAIYLILLLGLSLLFTILMHMIPSDSEMGGITIYLMDVAIIEFLGLMVFVVRLVYMYLTKHMKILELIFVLTIFLVLPIPVAGFTDSIGTKMQTKILNSEYLMNKYKEYQGISIYLNQRRAIYSQCDLSKFEVQINVELKKDRVLIFRKVTLNKLSDSYPIITNINFEPVTEKNKYGETIIIGYKVPKGKQSITLSGEEPFVLEVYDGTAPIFTMESFNGTKTYEKVFRDNLTNDSFLAQTQGVSLENPSCKNVIHNPNLQIFLTKYVAVQAIYGNEVLSSDELGKNLFYLNVAEKNIKIATVDTKMESRELPSLPSSTTFKVQNKFTGQSIPVYTEKIMVQNSLHKELQVFEGNIYSFPEPIKFDDCWVYFEKLDETQNGLILLKSITTIIENLEPIVYTEVLIK
ncbi:MAG: hypothetical protein WCJ58_04895 [bacterium]